MRRALRISLLSLAGFWLVLLCSNVTAYAEKRIALVIGNSGLATCLFRIPFSFRLLFVQIV